MNAEKRFTAKQIAFIHWYCSAPVNMNATEAARRAGYRGNDNTLATVAAENMRKPAIRREIECRLKLATKAANVTVEMVLNQLDLVYARAVAENKLSTAIRVLELQGKYLGMWNRQSKPASEFTPRLKEMSLEELADLLLKICDSSSIDLEALTGGRVAVR